MTSFSIGSRLLKGALIYFGAPMIVPVPNVISFQYNPESMTRTMTPWQPLKRVEAVIDKDGNRTNKDELKAYVDQVANLSQPFDPQENFSLTLELDASDGLETPEANPVTVAVGVAERLAAIEMLLYPPGDSGLGGLIGNISISITRTETVDGRTQTSNLLVRKDAPIVLFFWGPGRILPVRIMSMTIEEQQYSPTLFPIRAKATIGMRVLSGQDLLQVSGHKATGAIVELAQACYDYTNGQKKALALANIGPVKSILGMLPI